MSRNRDIERTLSDAGDEVSNRARRYASSAADTANDLAKRGRRFGKRLGRSDYRQQITRAAEDFSDEANYQYRRLRRQVSRNPGTTAAIVAGTIGAFLLLRYALSDRDED